jgi:hypothetical protein
MGKDPNENVTHQERVLARDSLTQNQSVLKILFHR